MLRAALAITLLGCSPGPSRAPDCSLLPNHATIIVDQACGGVLATARSIWTAAHCVHGTGVRYERCGSLATQHVATLLTRDDWLDLAELQTEERFERLPYVRLPTAGEPVTVVHHRCDGGWCAAPAQVVEVNVLGGEGAVDWTPPDGASGSGVWAEDGALVGVMTSVGLSTGHGYFALLGG